MYESRTSLFGFGKSITNINRVGEMFNVPCPRRF